MSDVNVIDVMFFEPYNACYSCKGKVVTTSDLLENCNRCGITQRLDRCQESTTAKLD